MSLASSLAVLVTVWGVVMSLSPLLQIRAVVRTRSSADVSVGYLGVLLVGFVLWFAYGVSTGEPALMITNAASLATYAATLAVVLRYRPRARQAMTPNP
jgi:MtN3 and saliva related transmembrane protein